MKNLFRYGVPVTGEFYFPRPDTVKKMLTYVNAGQKVLLYGRRRFGKTSFLKECSVVFKKNDITTLYIDVYPITSLHDFLFALTTGIKESRVLSVARKVKDIVSDIFRLRPRIVLEGDGAALDFLAPSLGSEDVKLAIEDTIRLFARLNEKQHIAIIFDEFQKIAEINDGNWLEGTLRSEIQKQGNVPYIFCGSRRGLILDMFQNSSRPFYQMCTPIELPKLGNNFVSWLREKLCSSGIKIDDVVTRAIMDKVDWNPNYAQMVAFHLVANAPNREIRAEDIDIVLDDLCQLNGYMYTTLYDSLSANAERVVKLLAMNPAKSPFNAESMKKFGLTSSGVQAALKGLVNKHIMDDATTGGAAIFDDPLFLRWIKKSFSY